MKLLKQIQNDTDASINKSCWISPILVNTKSYDMDGKSEL